MFDKIVPTGWDFVWRKLCNLKICRVYSESICLGSGQSRTEANNRNRSACEKISGSITLSQTFERNGTSIRENELIQQDGRQIEKSTVFGASLDITFVIPCLLGSFNRSFPRVRRSHDIPRTGNLNNRTNSTGANREVLYVYGNVRWLKLILSLLIDLAANFQDSRSLFEHAKFK